VPWALLYTISIDSSYGPGYKAVRACPLVTEWDGKTPLVSRVQEAASKSSLEQLISHDLPVLYFYCHGERPNAASRETFLGIGNP
jgi:hypothetical protein